MVPIVNEKEKKNEIESLAINGRAKIRANKDNYYYYYYYYYYLFIFIQNRISTLTYFKCICV